MELKRLLIEIEKAAMILRELFWTEEEQKEIRSVLDSFDQNMKETAFITVKHMEIYQQYDWKELYVEGEIDDKESK